MKFIWFILFLPAMAEAGAPDLGFLCRDLLHPSPVLHYEKYFTPEFREAIPADALIALFADLSKESGSCLSQTIAATGPDRYRIILRGARGLNVELACNWDARRSLVSGLRLTGVEDPSIKIEEDRDFSSMLRSLDPEGFLAGTLITEGGSLNLHYNSEKPLAIGSTFKLYVLGALKDSILKGEHHWEELLPLREEWKSLPSGIMQDWPAGKESNLLTYAQLMISESDNTATDHLIHLLGRERVEQTLSQMGHSRPQLNSPLLTTLEAFKLKWGVAPDTVENYLRLDRKGRIDLLQSIASFPRDRIFSNGVDPDHPTLIDRIEWFASTKETCSAMFSLDRSKDPLIRKILSGQLPAIETPGSEGSHWSYAGYKGGSEPGVLNLTYLLETKKGNRACLSLSWNNPAREISLTRFLDLAKKTLKYAETRVP
jgi:hypothetical protein